MKPALRVLAPTLAALVLGVDARGQSTEFFDEATLVPSDGADEDDYGTAFVSQGDLLVVGSPGHEMGYGDDAGALYPYRWDGAQWVQEPKIVRPHFPQFPDSYGRRLALSGDTLMASAAGEMNQRGAVYAYQRVGDQWLYQQRLAASDGLNGDIMGVSVDVDGDVAVFGAVGRDEIAELAGAVYVFERQAGTWAEVAKLLPPSGADYRRFGHSVSVVGTRIVVGEPYAAQSGRIHVYERLAGVWTRTHVINGAGLSILHAFGWAVDLEGDRIAVAAPGSSSPGGGAGRVFLYELENGNWVRRATLEGDDGDPRLGAAVALRGDRLLAGRTRYTYDPGGAYLFVDRPQGWQRRAFLGTRDPFAEVGSTLGWVRGRETIGYPEPPIVEGPGSLLFFDPRMPTEFCYGFDSGQAACPCGASDPLNGCDNAQGSSVRLDVIAVDRDQQIARIGASGFDPSASPTAVVVFSRAGGTPTPFGDGALCVDTTNNWPWVVPQRAENGVTEHTIVHGTGPGTHFYQVIYRNQPAGFCTAVGLNLTNGVTIPW